MNDLTTILAVIAGVLAGLGFTSVVSSLQLQRRAERKLVESIEKQADIVKALEIARHALATGKPEPDAIANARNLVDIAAQDLSASEKKDIFRILGRGSERSQANYLAKLIDEIDLEPESYESTQRAS
jgi:hypothetical protein